MTVSRDVGREGRPNLQNLPKSDLRVRYTICARPGKLLVGCDLDAIELRLLAAYAGGALARAFAEGIDVHQQTADAIGLDRDAGKKINYMTVYGGGANRASQELGCSYEEAQVVLDRFRRAYPEIGRLKQALSRRVEQRGYITTIGGRRHYFSDPTSHRMINCLIQGGAADLFKRAAIELHEAGVPIVLLVHDEIVAEVPEDRVEETSRLLETALAREYRATGVFVTGLVAEASAWRRWSDSKQPGYVPA